MSKTKIDVFYKIAQKAQSELNECVDSNNHKKYQLKAVLCIDMAWVAMVVGHYKAPYAIFALFNDEIGNLPENKYATALMYGLAKKIDENFGTKEQPYYREHKEVKITSKMQTKIDKIYKLVVEAHNKYAKDGIGDGVLGKQLDIFREGVKLENNKESLSTYLFKHQDELKDMTDGLIDLTGNDSEKKHTKEKDGCCVIL